MRRFLIPAFFVVDGDDNFTEKEAEDRVIKIQRAANRMKLDKDGSPWGVLLLDEARRNKVISMGLDADGFPERDVGGTFE